MLTSGIYLKILKKIKRQMALQVKKKLLLLFKEKNYILDSLKKKLQR